ncbi:uncharacterized protein LOC123564218 [Mercenaria mercenaria]|uniref:uncharacterized protein LOC123564218 n=1 Tax=Mercenaria mercenaria TaxID=6596 RepID=UPI00234E907E|nr:uncharacterized protein LOC123564218 [Mercenaria mercenaria]
MYNACVNTMLYPKDEKLLYYMVAKCSDMYNGNQTISELCKTETDPCTSVESKLIYKNQHCALCNEEINCIPWEIKLVCLNFKDFERSMSSFTSIAQMQKALDIFDCKIQLTRVEQSVEALVCTRKDYLHDDLVSICNITGLWVSYNEDISWACENFGNPYKGFRNVFCYICNPSRANEQNVALTEDCLLPEDNNELSILHNACKTFPTSNRLAPFKNIYCYSACNKEQSIETDTTENRRLLNISESNDDTLRSELNISIMYSGENKFIEMKRFVNELLPGLSADLKLYIPSLQTGKVDAYSSYISYLVNEYSSVCGMETVCNSSKNEDTPIYGNPVCGECTCNAECAESENCCPDILLNQQPYSCLGAKMFPVLYKVVTNRMVEFYESSNETYRITDVCLRNDTEEELSHNCSSYQKASDFFTNIPVTTDTGNTYRNIYCFICNSNKNDAILQFQVFCDTCIEYGLFTNINNLLDMIKSHCSKISFVPVQGKSCRETYNLTIAGYSGGEKYVRKKTSPSKFKQVEQKTIDAEDLYKPVKKVYAACNRTDKLHASHNLIEQVCESNNVNILALPEYRLEKKVYKNFACFICNPETDAIEIGQYNMTSECLLNNSVEWYVYNWRLEILCNTTKPSPRWYPYKNMYCSECNLPPWELVEVHVNPNDIEVDLQPYKYIFSISRTDFENLERASDKNIITDCPGGIYDRSRVISKMSVIVLQWRFSAC